MTKAAPSTHVPEIKPVRDKEHTWSITGPPDVPVYLRYDRIMDGDKGPVGTMVTVEAFTYDQAKVEIKMVRNPHVLAIVVNGEEVARIKGPGIQKQKGQPAKKAGKD